jgi:hypothetical protein
VFGAETGNPATAPGGSPAAPPPPGRPPVPPPQQAPLPVDEATIAELNAQIEAIRTAPERIQQHLNGLEPPGG